MADVQMTTDEPQASETVLRLRRTIRAPRARVYQAWADSGEIQNWWGPKGFSCSECEWNAAPGGSYRTCMTSPDGNTICLGGTFREVVPPEKLVFTWQWENTDGPTAGAETLVTVEFHDLGEKTEILLVHERFPDAEARDAHEKGWSSSLECLEELF